MKLSFLIFGLLSFFATTGQEIVRGPFLQSATQTGMLIKWRSNAVQTFQLKYGLNENNLDQSLEVTGFIDFEAHLENLQSGRVYFYAIKNTNNKTYKGSFKTLPNKDSKERLQFVALGDCGTGTPAQKEVLNQVKQYFGTKMIDGLLLLGDNAYNYGFDREYQTNFFPIYQEGLLKNTVLWPTPGNHDYAGKTWPNDFGQRPDYFNIFALPIRGESGGVPSGTEAYYSFDAGNVHFISLDSYGQEENKRMSDLLSKQAKWLQEDLSANTLPWTVVFFHHPPFSKGSHDSDKEPELIDIRVNLVPIFEKHHVDLVLTGHSHNYERSYPLKGFSGKESDFSINNHTTSTSSGRYNGEQNSCPYVNKEAGTIYLVAGTAGWVGGKSEGYPHDVMYYSNSDETGAVILEFENNEMVVKYISSKGIQLDHFTVLKDVNLSKEYTVDCGESLHLKSSWPQILFDNKSEIIIPNLSKDTLIFATDIKKCLTDTFKINVNPFPEITATSNSPILETSDLELRANFQGKGTLNWSGPNGFTSNEANPNIKNARLENAGVYVLKAEYNSCLSETAVEIIINPILSSKEREAETLLVYPNPSDNKFIIDFQAPSLGNYNLKIFNLSGILFYEKEVILTKDLNKRIEINHIELPKHTPYILKFESKNYSKSKLISVH